MAAMQEWAQTTCCHKRRQHQGEVFSFIAKPDKGGRQGLVWSIVCIPALQSLSFG